MFHELRITLYNTSNHKQSATNTTVWIMFQDNTRFSRIFCFFPWLVNSFETNDNMKTWTQWMNDNSTQTHGREAVCGCFISSWLMTEETYSGLMILILMKHTVNEWRRTRNMTETTEVQSSSLSLPYTETYSSLAATWSTLFSRLVLSSSRSAAFYYNNDVREAVNLNNELKVAIKLKNKAAEGLKFSFFSH